MTQPEFEQPSLFETAHEIPFDPRAVGDVVLQGVLANPAAESQAQPSDAAVDQGWGKPDEAENNPVSPEQIDVMERLLIVGREDGFYPTSRRELSEAFSLRTFREQPGGAAKHLAEVSARQMKHNANPRTAVESITNEYFGYARRARTDITTLRTLREEVDALNAHNPLETVKPSMISTGLGQLVRYLDLKKLAQSGDSAQFNVKVLRGYDRERNDAFDHYVSSQPTPDMSEHIATVIGGLRLWQLSSAVDQAITEQSNRFDFWVKRLDEARLHTVARPIAYKGLISLGVKVESIK